MKYEHPFYEIKIKDSGEEGSYYWFSICNISDKETIREEDIEYVKTLFSIEEGDIECFLFYFLEKYYDPNLKYNKNQDLDADEINTFYPWLVENVFTYESFSKMCSEIMEVANLLETDFNNPKLDDVKKAFSILYVCSEDDPDYKNVDKSEEAMKRHIDVVIDFYKRFVEKIRKAIEDYPNYNLIGIMGP